MSFEATTLFFGSMRFEGATLLVNCVMGVICALIANSRGRNGLGWFIIGFFFSCFGMIVLLVIPDVRKQEILEQRLRDENRLLREQIRNNRMVADQRHEDVHRRLVVHDRALGVDTSSAPELGPGAGAETTSAPPSPSPSPETSPATSPSPQAVPISIAAPPAFADLRWHYAFENRAEGPVNFADLKTLWSAGKVTSGTLVWAEGMASWTAAEQLPGLLDALRA